MIPVDVENVANKIYDNITPAPLMYMTEEEKAVIAGYVKLKKDYADICDVDNEHPDISNIAHMLAFKYNLKLDI